MVLQIENELQKLAEQALLMVEEYSAGQSNKYMTIAVGSVEKQAVRIAADIVLYTLLFAFAVYCASFVVMMMVIDIRMKKAKHAKA